MSPAATFHEAEAVTSVPSKSSFLFRRKSKAARLSGEEFCRRVREISATFLATAGVKTFVKKNFRRSLDAQKSLVYCVAQPGGW
jgi:hypothetical protein